MQFSDSETQKLLRDTARSFLADKYPYGRLYDIEQGKNSLSAEDMRELAGLGWLGLTVPEELDGAGASLLDAAVIIDECGYAAVPAPVAVTTVAALLLTSADGTADHIRQLGSGRSGYTVSGATRRCAPIRYGPLAAAAPLTLDGIRLSGSLPLVPFASISNYVLAPLTADGEAAFGVIPLSGARLEPANVLDRVSSAHVHFDGTGASDVLILGTGQAAGELHERCDALNTGFAVIEAAGLMRRVLEMSTAYIASRVQFGQPVAKFQAARHRAAELLMQSESARWSAYHAIWRVTTPHPGPTASLSVKYLRPVPIDRPLEIVASVDRIEGRRIHASAAINDGEIICAKAEAVFIASRRRDHPSP